MAKRRKKEKSAAKHIEPLVSQQHPSRQMYRHIGVCLMLALITWLAFQGSLQNGFVYDDNGQIVRNPFLHSNQPWMTIFTTDVWGYVTGGKASLSNYYRPMQILTYRWITSLAGLDPYYFHWASLIFHILTTLAVYALIWALVRVFNLAAGTALLFAIHPIHSEAVDWIAALPDLGSTLFYLVSILFLVLALRHSLGAASFGFLLKSKSSAEDADVPRQKIALWRIVFLSKSNLWRLLVSLGAFAFSLLWKEMAITLPLLVFVFCLLPFRSPSAWKQKCLDAALVALPYGLIAVLYLGMRYSILGYLSRPTDSSAMSTVQILLTLPFLLAKYLGMLVWPIPFNAFHLLKPVVSVLDARAWLGFLLLLSFLAIIYFLAKKSPLPGFFMGWILLTLLPVLNLTAIGGPNKLAERYLYLPSAGFCFVLIWAATLVLTIYVKRHDKLAGLILLAMATGVGIDLLSRRHPDWRDDYTFYRKTAESSPEAVEMHVALAGVLRSQRGDLEGSERESRQAIDLAMKEVPVREVNIANAMINLISIEILRGRYQAAWELIQKAAQYDRQNSFLELQLAKGICLLQMSRLSEARQVLERAYRQSPTNEQVLHFLGLVDLKEGKPDSAIPFFQRALTILPDYFDAHNNLATAYAMTNRWVEALSHFQKASSLSPRDPGVETNMALVLIQLKRFQEARIHLRKALTLSPDFPPALLQWNRLQQSGPAPGELK